MERWPQHVEDVLVSVLYALALRALSRLRGESAGNGRGAATYLRRAKRCEQALVERCLDPATGLFFDLAGPDEEPVRVSTWSALAPLALDSLGDEVRRPLVEEHLLNPRRYLAATGIPSVALEEPSFNPRFDRWRCWRGP